MNKMPNSNNGKKNTANGDTSMLRRNENLKSVKPNFHEAKKMSQERLFSRKTCLLGAFFRSVNLALHFAVKFFGTIIKSQLNLVANMLVTCRTKHNAKSN